MKYNEGKLKDGTIINLIDIKEKDAIDLDGKIFCPGEGCEAPLYLVHNTKDGGKSIFFKATNNLHISECDYKNDESTIGRAIKGTIDDGYYTEGQINDYVRRLYKDLTTPIDKKKNKDSNRKRKKGSSSENGEGRLIISGGRIVTGDGVGIEGTKGRMSRRMYVTDDDINHQVGVYGNIKTLDIDKYGQVKISFKEKRLNNIIVLIGQIYKNFNPQEFNNIYLLKEYFEKLHERNIDAYLVAGGLVTKYSGQLTLVLQSNYSFRVNDKNMLDIMRRKY